MKRFELCYKYTLKNPIENNNDPIYKLIFNYEDIEDIKNMLKHNNESIINQFLYFNKNKIHQILYDGEICYEINSKNFSLSELFYLNILILDNPEIINYTYSLQYFKDIHSRNINRGSSFEKIIIAKIILSLIFNFRGSEYDEKYEEEINQIENENKEIIKKDINIFKQLQLEYKYENFCEKKLDLIYMEIINSLIKNNKFSDYQYCINLIKELDIKYINITKTMYDGISKLLEDNDIMDKYKIDNVNDITKEKINFYYILIIYILKNSFYIYQIDFLRINIQNFVLIIKNSLRNINNEIIMQTDYDKKIGELLTFLVGDKCKIYKDYHNYKKKNEVKIEPSQNKSNTVKYSNSISKYFENARNLNDNGRLFVDYENTDIPKKIEYEKAVNILSKLKIIIQIKKKENETDIEYKEILYGDSYEFKLDNIADFKFNANYEEIDEKDKKDNPNAKIIYKNYKKLLNYIEEIENYIKKTTIQFEPQITLEIEEGKYSNKATDNFKDVYYLNCIITFVNQLQDNEKLKFKDENILVNSINGKSQGFINLMNELMNEDYNDAIFVYPN